MIMDKSFAEFMAEFEEKGREHARYMEEKRRKDAARKKLEKGTPELPERQGKLYDARNDEDRKEAIRKLEQGKKEISDIRQLGQYKH
jgi:hypothetical protein